MKLLLAAMLAGVLALAAAAAPTISPGPSRIRLTGSLIEQRYAAGAPAKTYALFNRPAYADRLGTAVVRCLEVSTGWVDCTELLRLSRGEIIARGLVPSAARYRVLAIVGGTGYYANVGGDMSVQTLGASGQVLLVDLIAY